MARPKSEFLSAWGTMYEIIKALVDEVLSLGGNDESVRLILTDEKIRRQVAEILMNVNKSVESVQPQPLLKLLGTVTIPATTEKFAARDRFKVDTSGEAQVHISFLGDNFKVWFLEKTEEPIGVTELRIHQLLQPSVDSPIIAELGGEDNVETTFAEIYTLMEKQGKGEDGTLLTNGSANIFYVYDTTDILRTVFVGWNDDCWCVNVYSIDSFKWFAKYQVFSRNSRPLAA